ncbi:mediator of DNA damage checkpoint protein 1-like [Anopheles maculipalpis]|uniref:mediator of DNA damage checkpoint protein 1-like n=1 Tax=Anopheles maculipalpis TaxID=1496333 RepID=UPI00215926A1|nr:mediator of DNA damage checkpoint protein 1-like [Anopheles maculipalpis]
MHLNVQGTKHPIRPGLSLIGSVANERYNTILLQDRSICPKHASLRFDSVTNKLEILDLCSIQGVSVNQKLIDPLCWKEITTQSQVQLGSVLASVEIDNKETVDEPSFLHNEDSTDVIDCSLEETTPSTLQGSRKMVQPNVALLATSQRRSSLIETAATVHEPPPSSSLPVGSHSFLVPETQQFNDSIAVSSKHNEASIPKNDEPAENNELNGEDDEDFFFIPETQQPEDELACPSEVFGVIGSGVQETPAEQTAATEDEYFQMTADNDENSNDGMFNNKYVEESQNLMENLDVSYNGAVVASRGSILPERSVDSISFQELRNTTNEMSRIEWNESKKEDENLVEKRLEPTKGGGKANEADDRSITPELHFDNDPPVATVVKSTSSSEEICRNKTGSVPEANQLTENAKAIDHAIRSSVTPELRFDDQENVDDDEHEISLNQEGCTNLKTCQSSPIKDDEARVRNVYEMETQPFADDDPYGLVTQPLQRLDVQFKSLVSPQKRPVEEDPYELQTQPLVVEKASTSKSSNKSPFLKPIQPAAQSKRNRTPEVDYANMPTQPFSPPEFLYQPHMEHGGTNAGNESPHANSTRISVFKRQTKDGNTPEIDYANLPTQPFTPPELLVQPTNASRYRSKEALSTSAPSIDDDDLLTQPLSPPKEQLDTPVLYRAASAFDPYNLDTHPLNPAATETTKDGIEKKKPILKLVDLKACHLSPPIDSSLKNYHSLVRDGDENVYDIERLRLLEFGALAEHEVSQFNPQINSTTRLSLVQAQHAVEPGVQISPTTSNKENHTIKETESEEVSHDTDEEELGLAETIPIETLFPHKPKTDCAENGKEVKLFKIPLKKSDTLATPKAQRKRKEKGVEMSEFLTPEHPMLLLPKADVIRSVSDQMRGSNTLQSNAAAKPKPKYHFNESSSSSDDEDHVNGRLAFKKTNVSIALEKELANVREIGKLKKQQELSAREKLPPKKEDDEKLEAIGKVKARDEDSRCSKRTAQRKASVEVEKIKAEPSKRAKDVEKSLQGKKKSSRTVANGKEYKPHAKQSYHCASETTRPERKSSEARSSHGCPNVPVRVSTRQRRDSYKKRMMEESVDYLPDSPKKSSNAVSPPSTRASRKRKEDHQSAAERVESCKIGAVESKRHKTGPSEVEKKEERTRRTSTASRTNKVVGKSSDLFEERGISSDDLTNDRATGGGSTTEESDASAVPATRSTRLRLIFTKMNPEPYRQCIARAGGKIVDMPELATILVTDHIIRTYKFLCSVAKGIPIVGQSYLDALQKSGGKEYVDAWDHILSDPVKEKRYDFNLRETLLKAKRHKLFQDYTVFVTSSTQPPPSELCLILSCAGAKISKHSSQSPKNTGKMFVISDPADSASWVKYREKFPNIEIVSTEGFMLSIMQHSINFRKYRLL